MKNKIANNLLSIVILIGVGSNFLAYGQNQLSHIPYCIDIKKNINNIKSVNLSLIGKKLNYIALETNPDCLIQKILHLELSESYLFIHDYDRILQFQKSGKFIRQIGVSGRGPKEYYNIRDFGIDESKKEIYIISSPQSLIVYDFDGVFKNSFKLPYVITQIIIKDKSKIMYHLANHPGQKNPSWIITNDKGSILTSMKNTLKRISQPGFSVLTSPLYSYNKNIYFMEFGIDTLYYFRNNKKYPYAIFFFDDLKMDSDPLFTPSMVKNKEVFIDKLWPGTIMENDEYIFIKLYRGVTTGYFCAIFNKTNNSVTFLKDDAFTNDITGGVRFWPKKIIDNKLIDYTDAFDLLKYPLPASLRGKITEISNPVIMILNDENN